MPTACIGHWRDEMHFGSEHIAFSHQISSSAIIYPSHPNVSFFKSNLLPWQCGNDVVKEKSNIDCLYRAVVR